MQADDYLYDGITLSAMGYILADTDDSSGLNTIETDSQRSFSSLSMFNGAWQPLSVSTYKDALKIEFSVVKNPCNAPSQEDMYLTLNEIRQFKRWMNRPTFHEFRIFDKSGDYDGIFFMGSANVEEIHVMGHCVGFDVTLYTDRPFALADEVVITGDVVANGTVKITDFSDEEGYIYPEITLELKQGGNLEIVNDFDDRHLLIKNCVVNEVITITRELQISTSKPRNIGKYFNWKFIRISNNYKNRVNNITFSLPCKYTIKYNPIVKAVVA